MEEIDKDADSWCAARAYGRVQAGGFTFDSALREALREVEPRVAAGRVSPLRFLADDLISRLAEEMEITDDAALVLLGVLVFETVHEGLLEDSEGDEEELFELVVSQCETRKAAFGLYARSEGLGGSKMGRRGTGRQAGLREPEELSDKAREMAALVSRYSARCANREPEVKEFRLAVLGGRLLNPGELEAARRRGPLASPAAHARARGVTDTLVEAYGWDAEDAVRFLLTGEPPELSPLTVEAERKGKRRGAPVEIRITALPGTPAKYVTKAYRWEQRRLMSKKDSRPLSEKGLELYKFVVEEETRAAAGERKPSYGELLDEWNRRYADRPGYRYGDQRILGRALRQVEDVARRHSGTRFSDDQEV